MPATSDPAKLCQLAIPTVFSDSQTEMNREAQQQSCRQKSEFPFLKSNISLTLWLSATQAKPRLASDNRWQPRGLLFFGSKLDDEGTADRVATSQSPNGSKRSTASYLVHGDEIMEAVPLARSDITW